MFARRLTAAPDYGEEGDWEQFKAACDQLREKMPSKKIDEKAIWKQAQDTIMKELRSPG